MLKEISINGRSRTEKTKFFISFIRFICCRNVYDTSSVTFFILFYFELNCSLWTFANRFGSVKNGFLFSFLFFKTKGHCLLKPNKIENFVDSLQRDDDFYHILFCFVFAVITKKRKRLRSRLKITEIDYCSTQFDFNIPCRWWTLQEPNRYKNIQ